MNTTSFPTLSSSDLETTRGGILDNVMLDANRIIENGAKAAKRLLGCTVGASSRRELGNCYLNGQLDRPATDASQSQK